MEEKRKDDENSIVIYTSQDGQVHINVRIVGETAWLTQAAMAQLFGCGSDNIDKHLKNIYDEGELKEPATTEIFSVVRFEGDRQGTRQISTIIWEPLLPLDKERVLWRDIGGLPKWSMNSSSATTTKPQGEELNLCCDM